jgi:hypothetical protein
MIRTEPGDTASLVRLRLRGGDGGREELFIGDIIHHPIQVWQPDWNSRFCDLPDLARQTRRRVLEDACDWDVILFPTQFAAPYHGRVVSGATDFAFGFGHD